MPLRGWIVKAPRSTSGERALIAAMISQALTDARRGSSEALRLAAGGWSGAGCALIGVDGSRLVTDWPEVQRPAPTAEALRCRRRYQERKARAQRVEA